jgi:hypothetical protein
MADAALNPAPSADAGAPAPSKPWYDGVAGVDQEIVGHWQNRGWDKKSAAEVALEATKAWKGAERLVGVPADQVLRVPKEVSDEAGWKAVWSRLGKPAEAKEYDFSAIKFSDGTPLDDAFAESARQWAFKFNLPKDAATGITQEFAKFLDTAETSEKTEREAKLVEQKAALKKNWGANEAAHKFTADRMARVLEEKLGLENAALATSALEQVIGYDKIMDMFRFFGAAIGEDKFVRSDAPGGKGGPMTVEQATAKRADLMSDPVWVKAYQAGDKTKLREMMALQSIITGVQIGA